MGDSDSRANWQQITKLALSIVAVVGIVIVPRLPNSVVRPNVSPPVENRFVSAQSVDARLWQDPFEAVDAERERRRPAAPGSAAAALDAWRTSAASMQAQVEERASKTSVPPLVLLAFVPGGPYPENVESRRRTRYATLSGLRAGGLIPVDAEHVGYFETRDPARAAGLPPLIVYEWLQVNTSRRSTRLDSVLLLWLDERTFGNATVRKTAALLAEAGICDGKRRRIPTRLVMLGPAESSSVRSLAEDADRVSPSDVDCLQPTLVLSTATVPDLYIVPGWSRGGVVPGSLLERMGSRSLKEWLAMAGLVFTRVLPTDDELIEELSEELAARNVRLKPANPANPTPEELKTRVAILSEWDSLYGRRGVEMVRSFICGERRGSGHSRGLPRPPAGSWCDGRVQLFEYPRGLDGVLPGRETKKTGDRNDKPAGQGLFQSGSNPGERAEGPSQVDYLRRLAAELDRLVSGAAESRASWRNDSSLVIGVLGNDLYDKLLILQALRPQHPRATFFTFDLDARMLHGEEFDWTRNLLVISPLGLRLRPELQGSIPPFRDSYQTAYFLSARLAVDHARKEPERDAAGAIFQAAWRPRVFEIGRGKEFDLSLGGANGECRSALACGDVTPKPPALGLTFPEPDWGWAAALGLVGFILFVFSSAARELLERSLGSARNCVAWAAGLAGLAAIAVPLGEAISWWLAEARPEPFSWGGGVSMWPTEIIRVAALLLALVFCAIAVRTVRRATREMEAQYGLAPSAMPAPGLAAGGGLAANGHRAVNGHPAPAPLAPRRGGAGRWSEIYDAITLRSFDRLAKEVPTRSADLWAEYRRQSQGWRRAARVAVTMFLAWGVAMCAVQYFGYPSLPARGSAIRTADWLILFALATPVALWLQMYVVDVIRLCDKVTRALAAECPTAWPTGLGKRLWSPPDIPNSTGSAAPSGGGAEANGSRSREGGVAASDGVLATGAASRSAVASAAAVAGAVAVAGVASPAAVEASPTAGAEERDASYWLDIRFTADWTARLSWLAYLPLIAICLMMAGRSRFFDAWDTPPGLYTGFALSLAVMVGCVGLLMHRATLLRRGALRHLQGRLRGLAGSGATADLERVKLMIQDVERADDGAFAPLTRQPIFGALAVTFGSAGITAVIQYAMGVR